MIKMFDYLKTFPRIEEDILTAFRETLRSGQLVLGPQTEAFEKEFAAFVGAKHCVTVSSGTTALQIALWSLGIGAGDEVITVANTCVPTIAAIRLTGATPVFVDVCDSDLMMDVEHLPKVVTSRTKCILPVHLWGQSVDMERLVAFSEHKSLPIVEDCAQAHGTIYKGKHVGVFGKLGCFSFYPTKNLGAYGEGGAIVTDDESLAKRIKALRVYGYDKNNIAVEEGMNARISEIQAAILRVKLKKLPELIEKRLKNADLYDRTILHPDIKTPCRNKQVRHSFHQYVIRSSRRAEIMNLLEASDIEYGIHYPIPVHLMPAYKNFGPRKTKLPITEKASGEILSLPIHEALTADEIKTVAETINRLQSRKAQFLIQPDRSVGPTI